MLLPSELAPEILVRLGAFPKYCLRPDLPKGVSLLAPGQVLLNIEGTARFLIRDGKEIHVQPDPDAGKDMVRLFLLGSAMGILLHQRGMLPLHGCGIVHDDRAILFLGDSGIGKSTLAESFRRKGYQLITDDVSAVHFSNGSVRVFPAYPKINLTEAAATQFDIDTTGLPEAHNKKIRKYSVPVSGGFCQDSKSLAQIYVLQRTHDEHIRLDAPAKSALIPVLMHHTYRQAIIGRLGLRRRHFEQCAHLAGNYPVKILSRPNDLSRLHELADILEGDFR